LELDLLVTVSSVVEGFGEVEAVPRLVARIASRERPQVALRLPKPLRVPRGRLLKAGELERYVELASGSVEERGGILVIVDADDDCPAELAQVLLARANTAAGGIKTAVVLPKHEYENWFLAGAESLCGQRGLAADLASPTDPEAVRGAKEWLAAKMPPNRCYSETVDQPALTQVLDLDLTRQRSDSFDKCWRDICGLLDAKPESRGSQ
jgi:hypothetical protein